MNQKQKERVIIKNNCLLKEKNIKDIFQSNQAR